MNAYSRRNPYVTYEQKAQRDALDLNKLNKSNISVFPQHIYAGDVIPTPYTVSEVRDRNTAYVKDTERDEHPPHFSRFHYDFAPNGYNHGNLIGHYNSSQWCSTPEPQGMAPARFYRE